MRRSCVDFQDVSGWALSGPNLVSGVIPPLSLLRVLLHVPRRGPGPHGVRFIAGVKRWAGLAWDSHPLLGWIVARVERSNRRDALCAVRPVRSGRAAGGGSGDADK